MNFSNFTTVIFAIGIKRNINLLNLVSKIRHEKDIFGQNKKRTVGLRHRLMV